QLGGAPLELSTGELPHEVAAVDVDGDGNLDVATACGEPSTKSTIVSIDRSNGQGGFVSDTPWTVELVAGRMLVADVDRDDRDEVVLVQLDPASGATVPVEILSTQPDGTQGDRTGLRTGGLVDGGHITAVAVGDFDGDGFPDVVSSLADDSHV